MKKQPIKSKSTRKPQWLPPVMGEQKMPNTNNVVMITVKEVAGIFGVTIKTIYRWSNQRRLPCVKMGRSLFFPKNLINKILFERGMKHYRDEDDEG